MRCPKCGREVPDNASYCATCGSPVGYVPAPAPVVAKSNTTLIAVIVVIVVAVVVVGVLAFVVLLQKSELRPVLNLYYDNGGLISDPTIYVSGQVYNDGSRAGYGILHYTIQDSRGWSISGDYQLGRIEPNGGYVSVELIFNWPRSYGGVWVDDPTQIVPTWTYSVTLA